MDIVYSDRYQIDIGAHVFHMGKYARVRDGLVSRGLIGAAALVEPAPAGWDELALVHTAEYIEKTRSGGFRASELALLELPWSTSVAEGFRLMAGGTIAAARLAIEAGARLARDPGAAAPGEQGLAASANLGGGFHHAFADHGEGFCLFNDAPMAIRRLLADRAIGRAAIVDADVHQANGTAALLGADPSVFTYSIHQENNYPARKPPSTLDRGLRDGVGDEDYLATLGADLPRIFDSRPDLVYYIAGADPYEDDQLGGLRVTRHGLRRRDRLVFGAACRAGVPVVVLLAGGYARQLGQTVAIHVATVEEARLMAEF